MAGSGGVQSRRTLDSEFMVFFSAGTGGTAPEGTGAEPALETLVAFVFREKEECADRLVSLENTLSRREPLVARELLVVVLVGIGGR